jgi:hypothetical protein
MSPAPHPTLPREKSGRPIESQMLSPFPFTWRKQ